MSFSTSEAYAMYLSTLCDECETNAKVDGHNLCADCYSKKQKLCTTCGLNPVKYLAECESCLQELQDELPGVDDYDAWMELERENTPATEITNLFHTEKVATTKDRTLHCSICLEDMKPGVMITTLRPCLHQFHSDCIRTWIFQEGKCTCPFCFSVCASS